jgi:LmbE family N-acetylglucosaminyl deacetylase
MILPGKLRRAMMGTALAALILTGAPIATAQKAAQQPVPDLASIPLPEPSEIARPLPENRGAAALAQSLKRLSTTASVMMVVAHPDDEDGALLTYLSRAQGVRAILLTLTRGEGGQNALGGESYDALGLIRTNELLRADEFYGVQQLWGTEADFGFSKTREEAFNRWSRERVLYDVVLAVRRERPLVIVSTFVGGVSDGHGHHQVSGEIAQEAFKAAADPKVFPEQLKDGLQPWQPLAVYSMVPFAPIKDGKIFDYATGKWAPARFKNYVTGEWTEGALPADVTIPVGGLDPVLGRSYARIAREGWGQQKSQNNGADLTLSRPATASYHLWAVAPEAAAKPGQNTAGNGLFHNRKVNIDTSIAGLASLAKGNPPEWLMRDLRQIDADLTKILGAPGPAFGTWQTSYSIAQEHQSGVQLARKLAPIYRQTLLLRVRVATSTFDPQAKSSLLFTLDAKIDDFQSALKNLLGLELTASTTKAGSAQGGLADEMPRSVVPGSSFRVRVHTAQSTPEAHLAKIWFESHTGGQWKPAEPLKGAENAEASDHLFRLRLPEDAEPTQPYFTRPSIEQPYYDIARPELRLRSFAPYPLAAWAEFTFDGLPVRVGQVVQTVQRLPGAGSVYEPLAVTPLIGLQMEPEARILPLNGAALPVRVTVHTEAAAEGAVALELPTGWHSDPAEARFRTTSAGDTEPILFSVATDSAATGAYNIDAVARSGGKTYRTGWQSVGYTGLQPYNLYKPAQLKTRKIDVKIAPGLRIGYVMGTGDKVPEAIEALGCAPHLLTSAELASGDLSAWNVIVIGIRAYAARPELATAQPRLDEFVRRGGTIIVQYQSGNFPAPLTLSMGRMPERVVEETAPVDLLVPAHPLFRWPNAITAADFDGWIEERGHSFLDSWNAGYTALTGTADQGQEPQRGGLLITHPGRGTYIYVAYALYRQLPELVPGSYRLLANLLSSGSFDAASAVEHDPAALR